MNDDELERELRAHYRAIETGPAPADLAQRVERGIDGRTARGGVFARLRGTAIPLAAVAIVVVVAAGLGLRPGGWLSSSRPVAPSSTLAPSGSPTASVSPASAPASLPASPRASVAASPLLDNAVVDLAGTFPGGGLWAVRGSRFWTSTDAGAAWRSGTTPVGTPIVGWVAPRTVLVLDTDHAWAITDGPGSTAAGSGSPDEVLNLVASRTTDGGRTWSHAAIPGNYPMTSQSLAFVDADHGFLLVTPWRGSPTPGALLRTVDGGRTWSIVSTEASWATAGTNPWLGSMFTASDASTLWAGANGEAGPVTHPVLAVSRDGGRTWRDAVLPGIGGASDPFGSDGGAQRYLPAPALFADAAHGLVMVGFGDAAGNDVIYRTSDGGVTWQLVTSQPFGTPSAVAVLDTDHWLVAAGSSIMAGSAGGTAWTTLGTTGLPIGEPIDLVGGLDATHAAALVSPPDWTYPPVWWLCVTADGGSTWTPVALPATP
jgi:photosystem II stability/assembly factor-like uncharacterized protein